MKFNNYKKILYILWIISVSIICVEGTVIEVKMGFFGRLQSSNPTEELLFINKLPIPRELIPPSIKSSVSNKQVLRQQKVADTNCTTIELCAYFEGNITQENVFAWMGFDYTNKTGKYFIASYGQKAKSLGNGRYSTPKWSKKHLWMNLGEGIPPFPLQARFVRLDEDSTNEWYAVDYLGYKRINAGIDYSKYSEGISTSGLLLLIDPKTKEVVKYHVEYYNENGEYAGEYQIQIGDKVKSYFVGFKKYEGDRIYLFSVEDLTTVTSLATFSYKEQYPGKDFKCGHCGDLNLSNARFKYIFEAYGQDRSNFTEPKLLEPELNTTKQIAKENNVSTTTTNKDTTKESNVSISKINKDANVSKKTTSKSAPFSTFWSILFILLLLIGFKKNNYILR